MTKKSRVYQILTFVFGILLIILLSIMGITAIQKSLSFNVSFNVKPQYLCRIELNDDLIFCNTTKNNEITTISANASLNGNTLALSESFVGGLGATLNFAFYNYSGFKVKVSVGDKFVILDAYTSGNPTSKPLSLSNVSGQLELVFQEYVSYTITYNANNGTSATTSQEVAKGTNATLSVDTFTKEGYVISSWNTKPDGSGTSYANLSSISPSENITLYAQWELVVYDFTASISYEGTSPGAYYELIIIATTDQNFEPTVDNDGYGSSYYSYVLNNTYDNKVSRERSIEWKLTIEYKIHIFTPYSSIASGVSNSVKSITPTPSNTTISSLSGQYVSFAMTNDNLRLDIMGNYIGGFSPQ